MSVQVFGIRSSPQLQSKNVTPSANTQYITPSMGYDGLSQVTVNGSSNLISSNIKKGIDIFGVVGNMSFDSFGYYERTYANQTASKCSVSTKITDISSINATYCKIDFTFSYILRDGYYNLYLYESIKSGDTTWMLGSFFFWKIKNQEIIETENYKETGLLGCATTEWGFSGDVLSLMESDTVTFSINGETSIVSYPIIMYGKTFPSLTSTNSTQAFWVWGYYDA